MDWTWLLIHEEGQFYERKSCYDRSGKRPKRRNARDVARDVAETLSAMANADGGTLAVGIEDNGTPTGVDYSEKHLQKILEAPKRLVSPPLKVRYQWIELKGKRILVFEVDWSPEVHRLSDGRYLMRIDDKNIPFPAADIEAIKESKRKRFTEMRIISDASLNDLDTDLLEGFRAKTGLNLPDDELLLRFRLAQRRNGHLVLTLAAVLLFARDPLRWHPSCSIDFVKWEGSERKFGTELNVVKRERVEGPLPVLIEKAFEVIRPHIRERQRLVDLFFEERFEYPTFAWQEAIINAVAHRDYALEGTPVEVWMFDNRMEIRSPGKLVEPVTLKKLQNRERVHASRNPRIVRVLTEWGFMRELGEGIPRMHEVMEKEGLKSPEFRLEAGSIFTVVLYNTPVYSPETLQWLKQFETYELSPNQKRLLAYAHAHGGTFTSRAFQKLVGVDLYTASRDIKDLIRKGIVRLTKKGGRVYKVMEKVLPKTTTLPEDFVKMIPRLKKKGFLQNKDIREVLGLSRIQAYRRLNEWVSEGLLLKKNKGRGAKYVLPQNVSSILENASPSARTDAFEDETFPENEVQNHAP